MFSAAYVILPFAATAPGDAIRASLAPFQRGGHGSLPDEWLAFEDETDWLRRAHEARFTFTDRGKGGMQIEVKDYADSYLDTQKVRDEMNRQGVERWSVRFADTMDLDTFFVRFSRSLERNPTTGAYGRWLNPLGRWDYWDLGGRFDGKIIGDTARSKARPVAQISSGYNRGRVILNNLENLLEEALGQVPPPEVDILSSRNVELVATLLADARAGRQNAFPGTVVLPPGAVENSLRWIGKWPNPGPTEAFAWLGLDPDADWQTVAEQAYARFEDHWAAGVAYHF